MTVRPGRPADEPALRALQTHLREPSPRLLSFGLGTGGVLVSVPGGDVGADPGTDTGDPVGYVLAVGGRRAVGDADAGDVHVAELVVAPAYRREGRGRRLLRRLVDDADGRVTLLVAADNGAARALYEGVGFRPVGRRPDFYGDGADAVLMARAPEPIRDPDPDDGPDRDSAPDRDGDPNPDCDGGPAQADSDR